FIASWAFAKLGSAPELIRLPSLVAGMASIPLTYLVGTRAIGRTAGLVAAAIVALSPFMVYFSTEARGYALAIAFLLASTLTLLRALRSPGRRWWVAYAVFGALAMYSHYTAAFPLAAQLLWVLWAAPRARAAALVANLLALILYLPWLPGVLGDTSSSTLPLVEAFVASGFDAKLTALAAWAFGGPYLPPADFPGTWVVALGAAGVAVAAVAAIAAGARRPAPVGPPAIEHGTALLICLGLSAPALELALALAGGPEIFGSRNLGSASAGMALAIGALVSAAGPLWGGVALAAVMVAFVAGSAANLGSANAKPDFEAAARWIDARAEPGDVIVDVHDVRSTPVPLTPLDAYLGGGFDTFRPLMPVGPPPFLPFESEPPPAGRLIDRALREGRGSRVFVVGLDERMVTSGGALAAIEIGPAGDPGSELFALPGSARTVESARFPGLRDIDLFLLEDGKR
ncbi:MAG: glycosyltransferase family 39 protein, partial [Thermoleophilia bacterium]|nr:glycosyltransferase family 39 protein [Thermoleophilia bacterium]